MCNKIKYMLQWNKTHLLTFILVQHLFYFIAHETTPLHVTSSVKDSVVLLLGVNSGVMLMNLTRMRTCAWTSQMVSYYQKYQYDIPWGDQDLINIFFHFFPGTYLNLFGVGHIDKQCHHFIMSSSLKLILWLIEFFLLSLDSRCD